MPPQHAQATPSKSQSGEPSDYTQMPSATPLMSVIAMFQQLSNEPRQQVKERAQDKPDNSEGQHQTQPMPVSDVSGIDEAADKEGKEYDLHHELCFLYGS